MPKILHTADVHLGAGFSSLGYSPAAKVREAVRKSLERIVDTAKKEKVDLVVIAGDLFDDNKGMGEVIRRVADQLNRLKPTPVCILPGTHDCLDSGSVYHALEFSGGLEHVHVLKNESGESKFYQSLGIAIHGKPNMSNQGAGESCLAGLSPHPEARYNVALVHGSITIPSKHDPKEYLVSREEIASCSMDYVAMGHWHKKAEYSHKGVRVWYSGSPESMEFDDGEESGFVLIVEFSSSQPPLPIKTGTLVWRKEDLDLYLYPPGQVLKERITSMAGDKVLLRLQLKGQLDVGDTFDPDGLESELKEAFLYLKIDPVGVTRKLPEDPVGIFPDRTVGSNFVKLLMQAIGQEKDPERRALLEEALGRGIAYMKGQLEV